MKKYGKVILFFLFVVGFLSMMSMIGTAGAVETDSITMAEAWKQFAIGALVMTICLIGGAVVKAE